MIEIKCVFCGNVSVQSGPTYEHTCKECQEPNKIKDIESKDVPIEVDIVERKAVFQVENIANSLSKMNSDDQAYFFNCFFTKLRISCGDEFSFDTQINYIKDDLDSRAYAAIQELGNYPCS